MLVLENGSIGAPGGFRGFSFFRPWEEIASLQNEGSMLATFKPAAHGVLPVRSVKRLFPNVVAPARGAPGSLFRGDPLQRLAQVRAVPGLLCVSLVEKGQDDRFIAHESLQSGILG